MGCTGAIDARLLACPWCFKRFFACYHCQGKSIVIDRSCPECNERITEENMHQIGVMVEGESFFFTSKGESDALHNSKYQDTVYHNRAGVRIAVMSALTANQG